MAFLVELHFHHILLIKAVRKRAQLQGKGNGPQLSMKKLLKNVWAMFNTATK